MGVLSPPLHEITITVLYRAPAVQTTSGPPPHDRTSFHIPAAFAGPGRDDLILAVNTAGKA